MKPPVVSGKEIVKTLQKNGFVVVRQRGSHVHLDKQSGEKTLHVTVPVHANKDINQFIFKSIARQAGYSAEEFSKLFE